MTQATEACRELELQPLSDIDIKTIVTQGVTALDAWIAGHPSPKYQLDWDVYDFDWGVTYQYLGSRYDSDYSAYPYRTVKMGGV
ncbi:hypothetical protein MJM99_34470, partial [Salmonella enterica subsp. enterica serovar Kentucky]|nr:hypothetical protein [Salmonella enterica subsp. enterica serovar Kentucky]